MMILKNTSLLEGHKKDMNMTYRITLPCDTQPLGGAVQLDEDCKIFWRILELYFGRVLVLSICYLVLCLDFYQRLFLLSE
jgi:hypothetical protein